MREKIYILITLFLTGAGIMVLEILGTRIIGPYFGVSLYVWSSLITVTLIALAIGYWLGGRIADRKPRIDTFYFFIFLAGLWLILIPSISGPILKATRPVGIKGGAVISAFLLFTIPLILLGMVTPFAVRLLTPELKIVGATAGKLYAISTLGSVVGAVLTGFVLIPNIGVRKIIYLQALIFLLLWAGKFIVRKKYGKSFLSLPFLVICIANWPVGQELFVGEKIKVIYKAESLYGDVKVVDKGNQRWLLIDGTGHTVIDKKTGESLFEYSFYFEIFPLINPGAKDVLLIGLGGGAIPKAFSEFGLEMDIVEIDKNVEEVARKYFNFTDILGKIYIRDGREYISGTKKKYDFIILDAYSGDRLPFHMVSKESFRQIKERLKNGGILGINCPGFIQGRNSIVWKSIYKTLKEVFPSIRVFTRERGEKMGNIIFLASEQEIKMRKKIEGNYRTKISRRFLIKMLVNEVKFIPEQGVVLRDDFNPLELFGAGTSETLRKDILKIFPDEVLLN